MNDCPRFKTLNVYFTGYGMFSTIDINPSELLVQKIESQKEEIEKQLGPNVKINHSEILRVAWKEVDQKAEQIYNKIEHSNKEDLHLLIHIGVNSDGDVIHLESVARNCASGNDVDGCAMEGKIDETCNDAYKCKLDLGVLCEKLKLNNHVVGISEDAGDYLCNYVYFKSSQKWQNHNNVHTVFIHVPSEKTISVDSVYACVIDFLVNIKNLYVSA
jgi:pyroglutamyl-peptidase